MDEIKYNTNVNYEESMEGSIVVGYVAIPSNLVSFCFRIIIIVVYYQR